MNVLGVKNSILNSRVAQGIFLAGAAMTLNSTISKAQNVNEIDSSQQKRIPLTVYKGMCVNTLKYYGTYAQAAVASCFDINGNGKYSKREAAEINGSDIVLEKGKDGNNIVTITAKKPIEGVKSKTTIIYNNEDQLKRFYLGSGFFISRNDTKSPEQEVDVDYCEEIIADIVNSSIKIKGACPISMSFGFKTVEIDSANTSCIRLEPGVKILKLNNVSDNGDHPTVIYVPENSVPIIFLDKKSKIKVEFYKEQ